MTFIKLTFSNDGTQFDCNAERIALMYPPTEIREGTSVYFGGGDSDYVSVKETPEQILKLIQRPESYL